MPKLGTSGSVRGAASNGRPYRDHIAADITVPSNISLISCRLTPELNPVERIWLYLRERFLSLRLFADLDAVVEGCCGAWNRLVAEQGRIASLTDYPYLRSVSTSRGGYERS